MILTINDNNITKNDNVELIKGYIDNILKSNNKNKVLDNISFLASYLIKLNSIIHSNYKDQVKLSFKDDEESIEIVNIIYEVLWSINKDQNLVIEFIEQ